ncbi:hypothetical protein A0H81_11426 [Grifola frondosa]|uniref:Uncharacterized protein n=1 Tax=Grifola frondosa TaxID=5627 RepID=A0A1C7LWQ2_GRIFR|nr:hypothetical protein A0H81_11426 [Grifola frondosa]
MSRETSLEGRMPTKPWDVRTVEREERSSRCAPAQVSEAPVQKYIEARHHLVKKQQRGPKELEKESETYQDCEEERDRPASGQRHANVEYAHP